MYYLETPEMLKARQDAEMENFRVLAEQAKIKADQRKRWEETHQPCPHCGRKDQLPPWLM